MIFSDRQKWREFTTRSALGEILQGQKWFQQALEEGRKNKKQQEA